MPSTSIDKEHNKACTVSIALCTYNGARYLREQLDSLLGQTHRNLEIIAVDDCSTDNTVAILNEYAQRDPRLQVNINVVNQGLKKNFTIAFEKCTGDYIAPCDQDDVWMPEKLATLLNTIEQHALAYCDSELISAEGRSLGIRASDRVSVLNTTDPSAFVFDNCVSGHAMLFRRELLDKALPLPDEFFHDWWIAACVAADGGIIHCPQLLVKYRQHGGNITNMTRDRIDSRRGRTHGHRLIMLREVERRIALLAELPGIHRKFLVSFKKRWHARESQYFSFCLAWMILRNGSRLYATDKRLSQWFLLRRAAHYFFGVRLKRLFNRDAYDAQ